MEFIQIIEARTSDVEPILALDAEWEKATEGKRTARRSIVTTDRNDPERHLIIVFFDSYESAMENSALPETQEFAAKWGTLVAGTPTFHDLDVVADRS
jgi:quinol monooxygenase YgiN